MQNKKEPLRMCVSCREMKPKSELIRVVKSNDEIVCNASNKINGRGLYVCKNTKCVEDCCKRKLINKAFSTNVNIEVYNSLKESVNSAK